MAATKKTSDPNARHARVYMTMLNSPAWRVLGPSAVKLFMDMRASVGGTNNGNLNATLSEMKHRGWSSPATLSKALYELRALGFIAVTREGGLKMSGRVCALYRFTDLDVYEQPKVSVLACKATHDYMKFESVREAERALAEGVEKLRADGRKKQAAQGKQLGTKKSPVQKQNRSDSNSEPMSRFIGSISEQGARPSIQ